MNMGWMAWTWQTALFFGLIILMLVVMTLLAVYRPETPRRGILGFATTRSDRLFVTLIGTAFIFLMWIRFGGETLWYPLVAGILLGVAMFRFA